MFNDYIRTIIQLQLILLLFYISIIYFNIFIIENSHTVIHQIININ